MGKRSERLLDRPQAANGRAHEGPCQTEQQENRSEVGQHQVLEHVHAEKTLFADGVDGRAERCKQNGDARPERHDPRPVTCAEGPRAAEVPHPPPVHRPDRGKRADHLWLEGPAVVDGREAHSSANSFSRAWSRATHCPKVAGVTTLVDKLVSLVVPPLCVGCREPEFSGQAVCDRCQARLVPLPDPHCERCGAPVSSRSPRCHECRGRALAFRTAWAPFAYEGVARRVVSALKLRNATRGARFMATEVASRAPLGLLGGTLVPVPAHPSRTRRTGTNQAACLAGLLGRALTLPVSDVLERARDSTPQVGLARRDRLLNARRSVTAKRDPPPGKLVLVDDVYTTGATLDACARALVAAGGEEVVAVTFARALR
jgi:ComF family protein